MGPVQSAVHIHVTSRRDLALLQHQRGGQLERWKEGARSAEKGESAPEARGRSSTEKTLSS